ncbi:MAG: GNAT family N-acetyltransferase [Lysobacterales bacterium]
MIIEIGPADRIWHPRWCRYVRAVFPRAGFERWIAWGEWGPDYLALAWVHEDAVIAGVGLTRMRLLVEGRLVDAWQFGAVGCVPAWRSQGHARRLMREALRRIGDTPALLYANAYVLDFYPRFGFRPQAETAFALDHSLVPSGIPAPVADWEDPQTRARVHALSANGIASTERFGARDHGRIISWYAANGYARPLRMLAPGSWVIAGVEGDTLHVDDILSEQPFDLMEALPALIDRPVTRIRFGFSPERWYSGPLHTEVDTSACLFTRGLTPPALSRLPELAHT